MVTFSIQSTFKLDYPLDQVRAACDHLKARKIGPATAVDTERAMGIIDRYREAYRRRVVELAPQINRLSGYVHDAGLASCTLGYLATPGVWRACRCRGRSRLPAAYTR